MVMDMQEAGCVLRACVSKVAGRTGRKDAGISGEMELGEIIHTWVWWEKMQMTDLTGDSIRATDHIGKE